MKRGNTALKRVVSVASVAGMALALAVVAAPAASAAPGAGDIVRVQPVADSGWMNADGTVADAATAGNYSLATHATNAPTVLNYNQTYQPVRNLQIALPGVNGSVAAAPVAWAGKDLKIALAGGAATFGSTPTVKLSKMAVAASQFDTVAGVAGTHSTNFVSAGADIDDVAVTTSGAGYGLNVDKDTFTVKLPTPSDLTTDESANVYVLTVSGITLSVPSTYDATVDSPVVTAAVTLNATASGVTTLGVVSNYKAAASGDTLSAAGDVTLGKVTVTESVKQAFQAGSVTLSVTGTPATTGGTITPDFTKAKVVSNNSSLTVNSGLTGSAVVITAFDNSRVESFTVSGITATGVKAGTDLKVNVLATGLTSVDAKAAGTGQDSAVSFVADPSVLASVTMSPSTSLPRIAGDNRYETAADIAAKLGATDAVVIANGVDAKQGVDALSANFLAGAAGAPILLTAADALPKETKDALTSLFKDSGEAVTVYVMGKSDSVSDSVRNEILSTLKATMNTAGSAKITQVAGDDRYETSAKAANQGDTLDSITPYDLGKGLLRTAFLASGQVNADALAAGAVSAAANIPVLLTNDGDTLPTSVNDAITALHVEQIVILGSTDRVSQKVEDSLKAAGVNVLRLAGTGANGRFDTAVKIATLASDSVADNGLNTNTAGLAYIANGVGGFPDALAIGPLAGVNGNVVLTVSNGTTLPTSAVVFLKTAGIGGVQAVGGPDRVTDAVIAAAQDAIK